MRKTIATLTALAALAAAPSAQALYGDDYGAAPINGHPEAVQNAPAYPDNFAAWAGACDRIGAPAPGSGTDLATIDPSGFGQIPATVLAGTGELASGFGFGAMFGENEQKAVPTTAVPPHCIDYGAPSAYTFQSTIWQGIPWTIPTPFGPIGQVSPAGDYAPQWRLPALTAAGGRVDGTTTLAWRRNTEGVGSNPGKPDGSVDNIYVDLPVGFAGDPNAVPKCTGEQFAERPATCPPSTQIGVIRLELEATCLGGISCNIGSANDSIYPVYNLEPRQGNVAEFGIPGIVGETTARIVAKVRTNGDFGVTAFAAQIPAAIVPIMQSITFWEVPWAEGNDPWRAPGNLSTPCKEQAGTATGYFMPPSGLIPACQSPYDPGSPEYQDEQGNPLPVRPFLSNGTSCTGQNVTTTIRTDAYQHPGAFTSEGFPDPDDPDWQTYPVTAPPVDECDQVGFDPQMTLDPVTQGGGPNQATDTPAGLDVSLVVPQNNDLPFPAPPGGAPQPEIDQYLADATNHWRSPAGLATSHLKDTVVTLPEGMTLNPSAADGQGVCTMAQMGITTTSSPAAPRIRYNNQPVTCPDSAKVGDVVVETPVLDEADWPKGEVFLAEQGKNPFGTDFAIYLAIASPERDLLLKASGKVEPDPNTGRLTTTFPENPQLPFERFQLRFKAGPRAALATPQTCGTHTNVNVLAPYSNPTQPAVVNDPFPITTSPAGGCPATKAARPLNVGFAAGSTQLVAGSASPFSVRVQRPDGNQELDRIEVTTPEGLVAKLAGVPYCPEAGIAKATARTATGQGAVEKADPSCPAASQVGTTTIGAGAGSQPYYVSGKAYLAGPYRGAPISMVFIVPAVAGPFDLGVQVVRTALNVNPKTAQVTASSDGIPKILRGIPLRLRDVRVEIDRPGFTVNPTDCAEQTVTGKVFGASGAVTNVSNRFQIAECNRLGFKPNLKLTLYGGTKRGDYQRLKAVLTTRPGDANIARTAVTLPHSEFLAQEHIRTVCTRVQFAADACPAGSIYGKATAITPLLDQPLTGPVYLRSSDNTLPDLVAALKGPDNQPIEIELSGRTDSKNEGIRNTFDVVPDAPVTKFTLEMMGGKKSLIVNSTNICKGIHKADVKFDAQNGRKHNPKPRVTNPACGKAKKGKKKAGKKGSAKQRTVAKRSLAAVARELF